MAILKSKITGKYSENLSKNAKNNNQLETIRVLTTKYKLSGSPVFTISLPGGQFAPLPRQLRHIVQPFSNSSWLRE